MRIDNSSRTVSERRLTVGRKLILVRETWTHMSDVSGFDPLFACIERSFDKSGTASIFVSPHNDDRPTRVQRLLAKFYKRPKKISGDAPGPFSEYRHDFAARQVIRLAQKHPNALILLSAGENQFGLEFHHAPPDIKQRLVVCLHQPPSYLRLHWRDFSALNGLHAIVCLAAHQQMFLSEICNTRILRIKHGVCHDFFAPSPKRRGLEKRVLFVGQCLRDFDLLHETMLRVWQVEPNVELDCVIIRDVRYHPALLRLARSSQVRWHTDLPADSLLHLYRNADVLFQPLIDSTANNAIVEALACGVAVVATNVGGASEYLPLGSCSLCPLDDAQAHANAVVHWLSVKNDDQELITARRSFAVENFSWDAIARGLLSELHL